ncbi:choice-of-anchor D domain-containing protein [Akkermansiaceae bacterium]|nr:choice-of-anchor D domain-containing protein [Akkermansiaceae bacterium]
MKFYAILALLVIPAKAAVLWNIGVDDSTQDGNGDPANGLNDSATFDGVAFNVSGVRETTLQDLPGNPANIGGLDGDAARDVDDDYYFAGIYNTVVDGGTYTPVGEVLVNESFYDRALTANDPNMRWHFNLPDTVAEGDNFTFTIDFYNMNEATPADISSYDLTFWVNGTQIGEMQPHLDVALSSAQSWNFDLDDLGGAAQIGEGFDHYVEVRSTPTGSARWASLDYVQLEVSSDPIVEDDPNIAAETAVNFGDFPIESAASTETIAISNTGLTQDLVITELTLGGDNADLFSITNAPALPITVAPGADTQIEVTLTPGAIEQSVSATLTVTSNDTTEVTQVVFLAAKIFIPFNDEGTLWFVGTDDDGQDGEGDSIFDDAAFFNGTDFFVSGVQENGTQDLPGNPANIGGPSGGERDIDDDFYFAGVYNTVVDGGDYTPVGIVAANERYYDRALTTGDPNMRWHFNVPDTVGPNDAFTFTIDYYSLDDDNAPEVSGFDLTFFVDGQQIGDMQPHTDDNLAAAQSWDFTLDDLGGVAELGPGFDHYVEVKGQSTGSARWANLDYAKLDITPGAIRDLVITEIAVDPTNDNVTFSFQARVGEVYVVERSTSLLPTGQPGGWLEIEDFLEAESEIQSFTDFGAASGNEKYFYRVRVAEE